MKGKDIKIGGEYYAKVSGRIVPVRVDSLGGRTSQTSNGRAFHNTWICTNLMTGRRIVVKSAQRFRDPATIAG